MKWFTKSFLLLIVLLLILAPAAFAQEAAPAIPANSITGIAVADGRFDTLAVAAVAAGLADDLAGGEWTVFAPTDDAFAKLGLNPDNVAGQFSAEELADILLYHTLTGTNATADLKGMLGNVIMANGQQAGLKFYEDEFYVNDDSKVIIENILADNGYIHVVDTVILPPWPREEVVEEAVMAEEPAAAPMAAAEAAAPEAAVPVEAAPAAAPRQRTRRFLAVRAAPPRHGGRTRPQRPGPTLAMSSGSRLLAPPASNSRPSVTPRRLEKSAESLRPISRAVL